MLLIDSLYICNSGGLHLLEYLVDTLEKKRICYYLLADSRCLGKFDKCINVEYMSASLWNRYRFYSNHKNDFTSVLCFGNIPAPIKLNIPVYTYFHNINLLTLNEVTSFKQKLFSWLKRSIFRFYKDNTNYWLVQTVNTENELVANLKERHSRVKQLPFYDLPQTLNSLSNLAHGDDYVYVSIYTPAKGHHELLEAWKLLHINGFDKTLHLTIDNSSVEICEKIKALQLEGVRIINHGQIPFKDVITLYQNSKALIYPSHNESLGLGIVEAITAGCDVIGADLPYTKAICKPSCTFNPYSPDSIVSAVLDYENNTRKKSQLLISNMINELIEVLSVNNKIYVNFQRQNLDDYWWYR